ncbi:hypothetical protein QEN19_004225 [Hanseniaspora menglaensis]
MKLIPKSFSQYYKARIPFQINIRYQLIIFVLIIAVFSLVTLSLITGLYFTSNFKSLRADKLFVAAQLKSSQLDQTLNYYYYECQYLTTKSEIETSLISYKAGNNSESNWYTSTETLDKFLSSSNTFTNCILYDSNFDEVLSVTNNASGNYIAASSLASLMPLSTDDALPISVISIGMLSNPVTNGSNTLLSLTLPIITSESILLRNSETIGYLTIVIVANQLTAILNNTDVTISTTNEAYSTPTSASSALNSFNMELLTAEYTNSTVTGYRYVFAPKGYASDITKIIFAVRNGTFIQEAFFGTKTSGYVTDATILKEKVSIGYSKCSFQLVNWIVLISQPEAVFLAPNTKLVRIIVITVFSVTISVFLLTYGLAAIAVKPIVKLQRGTELIMKGRVYQQQYNDKDHSSESFVNYNIRNSREFSQSLNVINNEKLSSVSQHKHNKSNSWFYQFPLKKFHNMFKNEEINEKPESELDNASHINIIPSEIISSTNLPINSHLHKRTLSNITNIDLKDADNEVIAEEDFYLPQNEESYSPILTSYRVPVSRRYLKDELTTLTDTFNTMIHELDIYYSVLEDRVRERTKELEVAKVQAETANEAKTVFIANISHELRTPLNGILGMCSIALSSENLDEELKENLKLIYKSGELLLHLLTELLTFSKNVLKKTTLERRSFMLLTDIVDPINSIFSKIAKDNDVQFQLVLKPNSSRQAFWFGDSHRILQIVMNLVSNALKFTPAHGKVKVTLNVLGATYLDREEIASGKSISDNYESNDELVEVGDGFSVIKGTQLFNGENPFETPLDDYKQHSDGNNNTVNSSELEEETDTTTTTSSINDNQIDKRYEKRLGSEENFQNISTDKYLLKITVEDTGPGISPDLQDKIFEPFVQGDQTLSRQYGGTGLGLSIVKQLAKMMNGDVFLSSEMGKGSVFDIYLEIGLLEKISALNPNYNDEFNENSKKYLMKANKWERKINGKSQNSEETEKPRLKKEKSYETAKSLRRNSQSGRDKPVLIQSSTGTARSSHNIPTVSSIKKNNQNEKINEGENDEKDKKQFKILIAEDNKVNQEVIKRMLVLLKHPKLTLAADGLEALETLMESKCEGEEALNSTNGGFGFDLVLMDVQMPKMDGLESTAKMRENGYTGPVVALTAFADEENIQNCLNAGMNGFVGKPVKKKELKKTLEKYLKREDNDSLE